MANPMLNLAAGPEADDMRDLMNRTNDPRRRGHGMTVIINRADEPYRDRERAYKILRLASTATRRNAPCLNYPQFRRHVEHLLQLVSARNTTGQLRQNRIRATRKVIRALRTVLGVQLPLSNVEQENGGIRLGQRHCPCTEPMTFPPPAVIYANAQPLDYQQHRAHLAGLDDRILRVQALNSGIHQVMTPYEKDVSGLEKRELWKYQATHRFIARIRDGLGDDNQWTFNQVEMSAVATPHDATSLWTALSYCWQGRLDMGMILKSGVYDFFYEVMCKGDGVVPRHTRNEFYTFLQYTSMDRVSDEEVQTWGPMGLFRSLARNDRDAGLPGYTCFKEIFSVLADFFGTEVVVFRPQNSYDPSREPDEECNHYDIDVYGLAPGDDGWGQTASTPLNRQIRHPTAPRLWSSREQILLVTDEHHKYVMPVRRTPDMAKWDLDTRWYDDDDRWPEWGQDHMLCRPPNLYLKADISNPNAIDPRAWLDWIPVCQLDVNLQRVKYNRATLEQPGRVWPEPQDNRWRFEGRVDAEELTVRLRPRDMADAATVWYPPLGLPVVDNPHVPFLVRDGWFVGEPLILPRCRNATQEQVYEHVRKAYLEGVPIPPDPLNGQYGITVDDEPVEPDPW